MARFEAGNICGLRRSRETLNLRPKAYASSVMVDQNLYSCTGQHGCEIPDFNECMWIRSLPRCCVAVFFFLFSSKTLLPSGKPWFRLNPTFGVNRVPSVSDRWRRLPTSRCPCLSFWYAYWKRLWTFLVYSCLWLVPRTSHPRYGVRALATRAGPVLEGRISWVTGQGW